MQEAFELLAEKSATLLADALELKTETSPDYTSRQDPIGGAQFDGISILQEVNDGLALLALRSAQVRALYASKDPKKSDSRSSSLETSRNIIQAAAKVVSRREDSYQVPWQRVAAWRENPTVYRYGKDNESLLSPCFFSLFVFVVLCLMLSHFSLSHLHHLYFCLFCSLLGLLWAVHSLYYWWRDQGLAESEVRVTPCYLNRMDASEVAVGWGKYTMEVIRDLLDRYLPFSSAYGSDVMNCFVPPSREFVFPAALYSTA